MSDSVTSTPAAKKPRRTLTRAVIRFAGDSGDGMQVTGEQFTTEAAWAGNDISTLPNFPAEIRAPAGTLFGVSSFQLQFGSQRVYTPGDQLDALVVMNPAAFKVHLADLKPGGILIVNPSAFDKRNLDKAGYASNPLDDPTLGEKFRLHLVDMEGLTKKALEDMPLNAKEKDRCKNFFALGLVSWVYTRPLDPTLDAIKKRFAKRPEFVEANIRALKAGHAFGETAEMFAEHYGVEAAEMPPGTLPQHDRQPRARVGSARRRGAHQDPGGVRRLSDHARERHPARAGAAQALPRAHVPGRGRDRGGHRGDRRLLRRLHRGHRLERSRHRAQGRGHRARGHRGAAAGDLRHPARRAEHRPAHQDRAGRPDAGPLRTQQRVAGGGDRPVHAGRLLLHRLRGGAARRQVHGAGHGALATAISPTAPSRG